VAIPKPTGGVRLLGVATVNDRVIQQAIAQVLNPLIDPTFSGASHGFRPGRNAHGAVRQIKGFIEEGYRILARTPCYTFWNDKQVVGETRARLCERTLDHVSLCWTNRPVRTRMPGGVGTGG